jgi:integrase
MARQIFKRIERHLYESVCRDSTGELTVAFYGRFTCRLKRKARTIPLGDNLGEAKDNLRELLVQNSKGFDFDIDRRRKTVIRDGKAAAFTFTEWAEKYPTFDDVKKKRSVPDDLRMIRLHLEPFFAAMLLTDISRESLQRYISKRERQTIIRNGKESKKTVHRGTISNELSLLRRMIRVALREGYKTALPSFEGLIIRTERAGRELTESEQQTALTIYSPWMRRLAIFAQETCLSEGDLLRLTDPMVDEQQGVIKPHGGRKKSGVEQVSPLTPAARAVLKEIRAARRSGAMVPNVNGLIFTRDNGKAITKDMIRWEVRKALKAGVAKFTFHNLRNTALTGWARRGIPVEVAMKASGHSSVQMHRRYVDLQDNDVAKAFGCGENVVTRIVTRRSTARRK